ncbi:MAG: tRNA (adenosine(37)-N6)-threonylcarbamoyltransferase complex dimerization subunit type 1 TsaB [Burkholderiaceae bacterium]|nr:tRNA (adenosine(37)-N6)-threonylcarbamoyltransferase complex dimerization subunit type 1 TsaB [Burkholderiaceae bacterium]
MTVLLALDTSTETMALALISPARLFTHEGDSGAKSSAHMVPELMKLLAAAGLRLADVDGIAFGRGPGAFTGLRTACAVAQGLAFGAGKPVLPLDSLMLVAEDAAAQLGGDAAALGTVWVAMDARMQEIYAASYRWQGGHWQAVAEPGLYGPEALQQRWRNELPTVIAGSALPVFAGQLDTRGARLLPACAARAQSLARLAQQQWARGLAVDPALALPVYVRDKVAHTTAEREAQRSSQGVS